VERDLCYEREIAIGDVVSDRELHRIAELAQWFQVSRKTAYKWVGRFAQEGATGLQERSRAPQGHPNATPTRVVQAVLQAKVAHPTWGPAKLQPPMGSSPEVAAAWPASSTRGSILARHGLGGAPPPPPAGHPLEPALPAR